MNSYMKYVICYLLTLLAIYGTIITVRGLLPFLIYFVE